MGIIENILSYLRQLNWVDIFLVILLIRICYIAVKTGFSTEIFKLLGTVYAIFLACHCYSRLSILLSKTIPPAVKIEPSVLSFFTFLILAFLGYFIFVLIRLLFTILIKIEAVSLLNHWGALILGMIRSCLFVSLLLFMAVLSNNDYFKKSLTDSFLGPKLFKLAPKVYISLWDNLMSRFMDKKAFNKAVFEVGRTPTE